MWLRCLSIFLLVLMLGIAVTSTVIAQDDTLQQKKKEIEELETKLKDIQGQKQTLAVTIEYFNTKIKLIQTQISSTESEIKVLETEVDALSGKITILDSNLEKLTSLLINRIHTTYKKAVATKPMYLLLTSDGFGDFLKRYKYLKVGQRHERLVMFELEKTRTNFNIQKEAKEEKQLELEKARKRLLSQKTSLDVQQREKQALLLITRNDEKQYQQLISRAKAELEAIQAVIAGKGKETEVRDVGEGDTIASVIVGESACSTGTHLHFEVTKDSSRVSPFSVLRSTSLNWDNDDAAANGSGSWAWPLNDPIRVTQSYGKTSYSSRYAGNFHTGIDIVNKDNMTVKSVQPGKLYRGAIGCGGGTLRYVRIKHTADGYDTYYLHVNY